MSYGRVGKCSVFALVPQAGLTLSRSARLGGEEEAAEDATGVPLQRDVDGPEAKGAEVSLGGF